MTPLEYFGTLTNKFTLSLDELLALDSHPPNRGVFLRVLDGDHNSPYYTYWVLPEMQGAHTRIHGLNLDTGEVEILEKVKKQTRFDVFSWGKLENSGVIRDEECLNTLLQIFEEHY